MRGLDHRLVILRLSYCFKKEEAGGEGGFCSAQKNNVMPVLMPSHEKSSYKKRDPAYMFIVLSL